MATSVFGKDELLARYPDSSWRSRFLECSAVADFLSESIITRSYRISDELNGAIALTGDGQKVFQELLKRQNVPAKEARLLCLLAFAHVDMLVDVEKTDLPALKAAMGAQIKSGAIRHPFVFGRELYDRFAELFEDERRRLSVEDTQKLLDGTSVGVFQLGTVLVGPYGVLNSTGVRGVAPTTRVPLFSCADITCSATHRCELSTDYDASINELRPKLGRVLTQQSQESSAWGEFAAVLADYETRSFDDQELSTIAYLLGDALSDDELRILVEALLDKTRGELRTHVAPLGLQGKASQITSGLGRAQLLQVALLLDDRTIARHLDWLVLQQKVNVPAGEIRRPVTNDAVRSGQFNLQAQLGVHGVRAQDAGSTLGPLRLRRLVDRLYLLDSDADVSELEWQLRGVEAVSLQARLEEFIRTRTPEEVLRRLVLARRTNMITACTELDIDDDGVPAEDDSLIDKLLWKLGFQVPDLADVHKRFWQLHERLVQLTQTAAVTALVDQEAVRALASNYFVLLEGVLDDSLAYTTWALTNDHIADERSFTFDLEGDRAASFTMLDRAERERPSGPEELHYGEKNTLYELCRGFAVLRALLEKRHNQRHVKLRDESSYPKYEPLTSLKRFPLRHTSIFLDLTTTAQTRILELLGQVSRELVAAEVNEVRNDLLHFRRSTADLDRLGNSLRGIERAVHALEADGLVRQPFRLVREQADEWGRRTYVLADPRGREIAFARPSSYDWLQLPSLRSPQYLMTGAIFAEPNEVLRFRLSGASPYARMWSDFPKRRRASQTLSSAPARTEPRAEGSIREHRGPGTARA